MTAATVAVLCPSRQGVTLDWWQAWRDTFQRADVQPVLCTVAGGSDLQIARSYCALEAMRASAAVTFTHALWLDDDILPPVGDGLRDHLACALHLNAPTSGMFVRRGSVRHIVGLPRHNVPARNVELLAARYEAVSMYCGMGCLALPWQTFEQHWHRSPRVESELGELRIVCCPFFTGEQEPYQYLSEDYAYCHGYPESYRVNIGYGHYAKNSLHYPDLGKHD